MNELYKDHHGIYTSKSRMDDPVQNAINQNYRNQALNKHYFNDTTAFKHWNKLYKADMSKLDHTKNTYRCICGHVVPVHLYICHRENIKCYIGSACIRKYGSEYMIKTMKLIEKEIAYRKTLSSIELEKYLVHTEYELDYDIHSQCVDCDVYIESWKIQCTKCWCRKKL